MESHTPAMRRQPQQSRSQERVEQLLNAAEQLFAERGYRGATTNAIAEHAGVPIGSLYQFFPNKEALLHAVTARYSTEGAEVLDAVLDAALPATALAERFLAAMIEFGAQRIAFTRIVLQSGGEPQLQAAAAAVHHMLQQRFVRLIQARAPHLPAERMRLTADVSLAAVNALLALAISRKPLGEPAVHEVLSEAQTLLLAYLAQVNP
ncbi:MAG TPA: TetR/AcrR family transcriptional regulator [Roseiflexaceae bacterium]|nr:TetR/AcrR family transcriptional regulator [Roseiflexaceae bacterium]HMP41320.1 TetR/AcrR family transcriptional regulator [Roseiflexaceae bacterium]